MNRCPFWRRSGRRLTAELEIERFATLLVGVQWIC
jgi:hypothetical protein